MDPTKDIHTGSTSTMLFVGFIRDLTKYKRNVALEVDQRAAQELLLNMLPASIAEHLQNDPGYLAQKYPRATILFADIVGFTAMSSKMVRCCFVVTPIRALYLCMISLSNLALFLSAT